MTINTELANDIRTVIGMTPNMHDQSNWFYVYEGRKDRLTPEDVHVVELLKETKEAEEKGINFSEFEPTVSCEATLCVAGWACIMNGYELIQDDDDMEVYAVKDDEKTLVMDKGADLLGLESDVADWLFCDTSDDQAIEALDDLAEGRVPYAYERTQNENYCCRDCDGY